MPAFKDHTDEQFGRLIAREYVGNSKWRCECLCGEFTVVIAKHLVSGHTQSCGCLQSEVVSKLFRKHWRKGTPEYVTWCAMLQRCYNENDKEYHNYGSRGIKVCKRWHDFEEFYKDMGERPKDMTLERKNNNKGYSPKNCIWATRKQQARNMRRNHMETYKGETRCLSEWCEIFGLNYKTVRSRLNLGWSFVKAITTPKMINRYA